MMSDGDFIKVPLANTLLMRPTQLNPLFSDVTKLDGIGSRLATLLKKLLDPPSEISTPRVIDLLWHMPTGVIDRRAQPKIIDAIPGQLATLKVRVSQHRPPPKRGRAPYRVYCEDDTGGIILIFFHGDKRYLERALPEGEIRHISGRIETYGDQLQMPHPDHIITEEEFENLPLLEPVYPLTAGLSGKVLRKAIQQTVSQAPDLPEWQNEAWLKKNTWSDFSSALNTLHNPKTEADISPASPARLRLAYDELLANQLALALVRRNLKQVRGRPIKGTGKLKTRLIEVLPFSLTSSQENALTDIAKDMAAPYRMLRLLQGDVGSGKTIVALFAMVAAAEAGAQATMMAPTEVLARQHFATIEPLAEAVGLRLGLLTGREKGRTRKDLLSLLKAGEIDILVGTHALFQREVEFSNLALAIIDEQHRFGVHQRLALQGKGGVHGADVLVMTATPIPRTLLLTHYGDMEVSRLTEKPAGRKPVTTRVIPDERLEEVFAGLKRTITNGAQVYWVCPLVEGSPHIDMAAAEERHAHLKQRLGDKVGLVHGQMRGPEKDAVMADFAAGNLSVLVSTTVIEVGVNVPNATIMVIEHAESFGLAQLHQLRGRVGRGEAQSSCILLYHSPLSETARARLQTMRETEDGFVIAEEDLRLRGGGEVLGTRQSGAPEFRLADIPAFKELLGAARDDAGMIMEQDPKLASPRGEALRTLLYLFECDDAVRLFQAG